MALIRGILFYVVTMPLAVILGSLTILALPCPRKFRYEIARTWTRLSLWWLRICCGLSWEVTGTENIPTTAGVIACKHHSAWETMSLQCVFPPQSQVLKRELLWIPFFGWALGSLNPIAINRSLGVRALKLVIAEGVKRVQDDWWVVLFPEGTRVGPGETGRYAQSAAALALQANCPLVPVAHNAGQFWPRKSWEKHPGTIRMIVGKPIATEERSAAEITRELQDWIETQTRGLMPEAYANVEATANEDNAASDPS